MDKSVYVHIIDMQMYVESVDLLFHAGVDPHMLTVVLYLINSCFHPSIAIESYYYCMYVHEHQIKVLVRYL